MNLTLIVISRVEREQFLDRGKYTRYDFRVSSTRQLGHTTTMEVHRKTGINNKLLNNYECLFVS